MLGRVPSPIAGGVISLYLAASLSISAAIGFVSLFGVSVMNNILIVTYYNQAWLARPNLDRNEAMFHAAKQRMRPMLMTALSPCIALFPAALSTGIGSQVQRPLAAVVVAGRCSIGPVMLLVFVPPLADYFRGKQGERLD